MLQSNVYKILERSPGIVADPRTDRRQRKQSQVAQAFADMDLFDPMSAVVNGRCPVPASGALLESMCRGLAATTLHPYHRKARVIVKQNWSFPEFPSLLGKTSKRNAV